MTRKGPHRAHLLCGQSASVWSSPPVTLMLMQLQNVSPPLTSPWAPIRVHLTNPPCLPEASFVSAQRGFSQKVIPSEYRWRKKKKKACGGTSKIVGGITPEALTGLYSECKCCEKNKCIYLYKRNASSQVIEPLVATEWRGVPAAWSAGLCAERGVQRWGPVRIRWEMARVWSPIRCQRCCGC